jgi:hypothetical protein
MCQKWRGPGAAETDPGLHSRLREQTAGPGIVDVREQGDVEFASNFFRCIICVV